MERGESGCLTMSYDFPKRTDWKWDRVYREGFILAPGDKEVLWDRKDAGWLYWFMAMCNSPHLKFKVDLYADGLVDVETSIEELENIGFIGTGSGKFLVTRYDANNNLYVIQYTPLNGLGVPFRGRNIGVIMNETSDPITIYKVYGWLIILR